MTPDPDPPPADRVRSDGKFFRLGRDRFTVRGVTCGPFEPVAGRPLPSPEPVAADFRLLAGLYANVVRLYHTPPTWFIDLAAAHGVRVLLDVEAVVAPAVVVRMTTATESHEAADGGGGRLTRVRADAAATTAAARRVILVCLLVCGLWVVRFWPHSPAAALPPVVGWSDVGSPDVVPGRPCVGSSTPPPPPGRGVGR